MGVSESLGVLAFSHMYTQLFLNPLALISCRLSLSTPMVIQTDEYCEIKHHFIYKFINEIL